MHTKAMEGWIGLDPGAPCGANKGSHPPPDPQFF